MRKQITFLQLFYADFVKYSAVMFTISVLSACVSIHNFTDHNSPVWTSVSHSNPPLQYEDVVKLVSYNIKFAIEIDEAIKAFKQQEELRHADIILLQEMDTLGTMKIARELDMDYLYFPATIHGKHSEYFGNAILSKWPIQTYEKIILPHYSKSGRQRIGVYAAIKIDKMLLHVYNVHLETMAMKRNKRAEQLKSILYHSTAIDQSEPVLIAGDFNSFFPKDRKVFSQLMMQEEFVWQSEDLKYTATALKGAIKPHIDQVYTRGIQLDTIGVSTHVKASDHFPVFFSVRFDQ